MDRLYTEFLKDIFGKYQQMIFLSGPRQVGKTTISKQLQDYFDESVYLNWDVIKDREKILSGQDFIEDIFPTHVLRDRKPLVIFDEIHKYKNWKNYLKGFYDTYKDDYHILVTGSAHLDIYQSGGDSLMGRYFCYTVFPLTLSETLAPFRALRNGISLNFIDDPILNAEDVLTQLFNFGGYPEPYLKKDTQFLNMWQSARSKQLIFEDIQTLTHIHDVYLIDVLSELMKHQTGQLLNRTSFAKKIKATTQTVSRWIETLERFYFCFSISPWHKNVTRSLIKEPKIYLWDWSLIEDEGARFENLVALHLKSLFIFTKKEVLKNLIYIIYGILIKKKLILSSQKIKCLI